jgi:broad specificity phosphatase PhoE
MDDHWPQRLWVVRHGESTGNVARNLAEREGRAAIEIDSERDVPLSRLGEDQSRAVARWFAALPAGERPDAAVTSPLRRARQTCELALAGAGVPISVDERLRDRDLGAANRLTWPGFDERYPELALQRRTLGRMYFRPPGGESWCDVLLRLRSFLETMAREHRRARLALFTHQVGVLLFRAALEGLFDDQIEAIASGPEIANCSITEYRFDNRPRLVRFNHLAVAEPA